MARSSISNKLALLALALVIGAPYTYGQIRVNAGGGSYTDAAGNAWYGEDGSSPIFYSGGGASYTAASISGTNDPTIYQTCRFGVFSYFFALSRGKYNVTLKFAEIYFMQPGQRVFSVNINNTPVLQDFDIVAAAGGANRAYDVTFQASGGGVQGITIQTIAGSADLPLISGIDIEPVQPALTEAQLMAYATGKIGPINTDDPSTWSANRRACSQVTTGTSGDGVSAVLGSCQLWQGSEWTRDISNDAVDPNSATWMTAFDAFGAGEALRGPTAISVTDGWGIAEWGMPWIVVDSTDPSTPLVPVSQALSSVPQIAAVDPTAYVGGSDITPVPVPMPPYIEGTLGPGTTTNYFIEGDKTLLVFDRATCFLYELWNTYPYNGTLYAGTMAIFDACSGGDLQRPYGWTSASVSGLSHQAGIITADEVQRGHIDHAVATTSLNAWGRAGFVFPAQSHQWNADQAILPPFGARMRLRQDFDISGYGPQEQVVLTALKKYGMIYVDGGAYGDLYWDPSNLWSKEDWSPFWHIFLAGNFDVINAGQVYSYKPQGADQLPPTGPAPAITYMEAYPTTLKAGSPVIIFWQTDGSDSMHFVDAIGPTRKNFAIVYPSATTTYTLAAQNKFGRSSQTVTVTVNQ